MEIIKTPIEGLLVLKPKVFGDERGYFFESFNQKVFEQAIGYKINFVQDNESLSQKGVLRGLHFQKPPYAQGKLVRVNSGRVLDVAVDLRKESNTYGECFAIELSAENKLMFWIPPGFAHGFASLEDDTKFLYKCTELYAPLSEGTIAWNDKTLNIDWKLTSPIVSEKDQKGEEFCNFVTPF